MVMAMAIPSALEVGGGALSCPFRPFRYMNMNNK